MGTTHVTNVVIPLLVGHDAPWYFLVLLSNYPFPPDHGLNKLLQPHPRTGYKPKLTLEMESLVITANCKSAIVFVVDSDHGSSQSQTASS
jgi:hypothetical protein